MHNYFISNLFHHVVKKFIEKKVIIISAISDEKNDLKPVLLVLPSFGIISDNFVREFRRLCKRFNINGRLVFQPFKVARYFQLRSRVPHALRSGVVYKYNCLVDPNIAYIGKRYLVARVKKHSTQLESTILSNRVQCNCPFSIDNFTVLRSSKNEVYLSVCKALLIKRYDPFLNRTVANHGQSTFLKLF